MHRILLVICAVALLATACGSPDGLSEPEAQPETGTESPTTPSTDAPISAEESDEETASESTEPQEEESVDPTEGDDSSGDEPIVEKPNEHPGPVAFAVADLTNRLGIDESVIDVVSFEEVTWPDGSLGCPEPDMSYTQALVNGSLLVLEIDGSKYEYHSGQGGDLFYCATPTSPVEGSYGDV